MKAALHTGIGKELTLVNDVELVGPKEGEVLIKTEYCGICHSDVSVLDSLDLTPMILGHEAAGVVEEIGDGVTSVSKGDYVLMTPIGPCGTCEMSTSKDTHFAKEAKHLFSEPFRMEAHLSEEVALLCIRV